MQSSSFSKSFIVASLLLATPFLGAATSGKTAAESPAASPAASAELQSARGLVSEVNLVNLVFSVEDRHGRYLNGLRASDVRVFEDGRPEHVKYFSLERQAPLTLALVIDSSAHQSEMLPYVKQMMRTFVEDVITPRDLAMLVTFDDRSTLMQDFTSSKSLLIGAIDATRPAGGIPPMLINPQTFPSTALSGSNHLWDAVYLACHDKLSKQVGRRVVVVVSSGDEEGSYFDNVDVKRALLETNTILYAIVASPPGIHPHAGFGLSAAGKLRRISGLTGGRTFFSVRDFGRGLARISTELRCQYTLAYTTDQPQMDGRFRRIEVALSGRWAGFRARARLGYFAVRNLGK